LYELLYTPESQENQGKHQKFLRKKLMLAFFFRVFYHFS